jgi:4-hydroxy-3-methylbut-2-enyl diphosphate reductase
MTNLVGGVRASSAAWYRSSGRRAVRPAVIASNAKPQRRTIRSPAPSGSQYRSIPASRAVVEPAVAISAASVTESAREHSRINSRSVIRRLILAEPRGYCAGVERAVATVEEALALWGPPIYVRKQIVHNLHVVRELEGRGVIFVETEEKVPRGARVVFSAHGVSPAVHERARARELQTIDATCPLVAKVHAEARHYAAKGHSIILIGHADHEEVEGTTGEAPDAIFLVESVEYAERVAPPKTERLAYLTQTTLSVDETAGIIEVLRRRFPAIEAPKREDICYATTNRQRAVKAMLGEIDLLLVIGSRNSSNSNRLVDVARSHGVAAHLIDDESDIEDTWLAGVESVGITSGASAPESLVLRVVSWFRERGVEEIRRHNAALENVSFRLPPELARQAASS